MKGLFFGTKVRLFEYCIDFLPKIFIMKIMINELDRKLDNYTWKFEDVYSDDHFVGDKQTKYYNLYSKSYLHENISTDIHAHEFYEMNIVTKGKGIHTIDGHQFQTQKGCVYVITPNTRHKLESTDNLCVFHILLNNYFLMKFKSELESLSGFYSLFNQNYGKTESDTTFLYLNEEQLDMIMRYCDLLVQEQSEDNKHAGHICNYLVFVIIAKLSKMISENHLKKGSNNSNEITIVRIMDYINTHYVDKVDIKTLTSLSLWSKTSLMKYFREYCGTTPQKYLYNVRSQKAKEKMDEGATNITFIANDCGFFDASHLNKHFKATYGITPKQYIKELTKKGTNNHPPPHRNLENSAQKTTSPNHS